MEHKHTVAAVGVCVATNINPIVWGPPGEGKSVSMQGIAAANNLHLETVIANIREPGDFAGIPAIVGDESRFIKPNWVKNILEQAQGNNESGQRRASLVFFDEFSNAPSAVKAALLRPVLERVIGDTKVPDVTRFIAAANPPDIAEDGWDLGPPMANRFTHIDWKLSATDVRNGFTLGWKPIEIPRLPNANQQKINIRSALVLVGSFLGTRPSLVSDMPKNFSGMTSSKKTFAASDYAFPTPRSWENAGILYAGAQSARFADGSRIDKTVTNILLEGTIGVGAAKEFLTYVNSLSLPDPEEVLSNPAGFKVPTRGDELFAVLGSVMNAVKDNNSVTRWGALGDVLSKVSVSGQADVAFLFARDWIGNLRPEGAVMSSDQRAQFGKLFALLSPDKQW